MEICNMQFNMFYPVDIVFNAIENLLELSEYDLIPISSSQAVNLAYVVFAKTQSYRSPSIELQFSRVSHMGRHEDTPLQS